MNYLCEAQNPGTSTNKTSDYFKFMGVKIDNVAFPDILAKIRDNTHKKGYICLTCVHTVMDATKDGMLRRAINGALLSIPDGTPLAWYGRLLGSRKIRRVSGVALMKRLLEEEKGFGHYLLGDTDKTIQRIMDQAKQHNTEIQIEGHSPPFRGEFNRSDNELMLESINRASPDIIWVSFGGGKQDKWMHENYQRLDRGIMIGVGAAFQYYIGGIKTPPNVFQNLGLQWFFRLLHQPRIVRGQLRRFPNFMAHFPGEVVRSRRNSRGSY